MHHDITIKCQTGISNKEHESTVEKNNKLLNHRSVFFYVFTMNEKVLILKELAKHRFEGRIPSDFYNIQNPVYTVLSDSLKIPKRDIFEVVLEMQPRVLTTEQRYEFCMFINCTINLILLS